MAFVDSCWFTAGSSGTANFADGTALTGFRNLSAAGAVNAQVYSYRAESLDRSQWEIGYGAYASAAGGTLARTTVVASSTGAKVNFTAAPIITLQPLKADFDDMLDSGDVATAAQYQAKTADKVLVADKVWSAATPVNLGTALTGNLTLDLATFIRGYGTLTGDLVLNAVSNFKNQSGTLELTASGANRAVSLNTGAFSGAAFTIPSGQTWLVSYFGRANGKVHVMVAGKNI